MIEDALLTHLRDLEVSLHQQEVRSDIARLNDLLHDSFVEFGRSGESYSKADILKELDSGLHAGTVWSQDFIVDEIADGVALVKYKSAHVDKNGGTSRHTLRSSLWQRMENGWQI